MQTQRSYVLRIATTERRKFYYVVTLVEKIPKVLAMLGGRVGGNLL